MLVFLPQHNLHKEQRYAFQGIQKTMIIQLASHCTMFSIPVIGMILLDFFEISYMLPFTMMIACGPTVTTMLTLTSVPEYRKKLKLCFNKVTERLFAYY